MKILGLIPARGGSKGIPRKNIKLLRGKPLIQYSIEAALSCDTIDTLLVSTDDAEIAEVSAKAGAEVPFLRPDELANDSAPTIDTVIHALRFYAAKDINFDAVCLLQPTCPFRTTAHITKAIQIFKKNQPDSLISVREVPHQYNPHWVFEAVEDTAFLRIATGEQQIIPRRQELPKAYHRDGSIYITKSEIILERHSLYGERMAHCTFEDSPHVNIDTMEDWEKALQILANG